MATSPLYKSEFLTYTPGTGLPVISQQLESTRAYQWELRFDNIPGDPDPVAELKDLTLGAKQISQVGFSVEDVPVHRVNDVVFYPGKPSPEELIVTFDNLLKNRMGVELWNWFSTIYDPVTGVMTGTVDAQSGGLANSFKCNKVEILQLDHTLQPVSHIELFGVYPKKWTNAELNYSTNEFNTVEMTFRYDFMRSQKTQGSTP